VVRACQRVSGLFGCASIRIEVQRNSRTARGQRHRDGAADPSRGSCYKYPLHTSGCHVRSRVTSELEAAHGCQLPPSKVVTPLLKRLDFDLSADFHDALRRQIEAVYGLHRVSI
jgi:hypothetical protein